MDQAIYFVIATVCPLPAYRFCRVFFVSKVLAADDSEVTPSHQFQDGKIMCPRRSGSMQGQHFAAIAAAGLTVGRCWPPVRLPARLIWLLVRRWSVARC